MKKIILPAAILLILNFSTLAQEIIKKDSSVTHKVFTPQVTGDDVIIKDESSNTLIRVIDEGTFGSIELQSGVPKTTTNKLYNYSGILNFNGTVLGGGAHVIDQLDDGKYDGSSLFLGERAGNSDDRTTNWNTGVGKEALYSNTSGYVNTAIGVKAMRGNIDGYYNTACGTSALFLNTSGDKNTAIGAYALYSNSTSNRNTAIGYEALNKNTTGSINVAIGAKALYANIDASFNTAIGVGALSNNTTGEENTAVGHFSGPSTSNLFNTTSLGSDAIVTAHHTTRIGNSSQLSIGGTVDWSIISDGRYKNNIEEDVEGVDFIMGLRPITYNLNIEQIANKLGEDIRIDNAGNKIQVERSSKMAEARQQKANKREVGFIAQEVEQLANELGFDFSGVEVPENENSMYRLRYAEFVVPIVKAMQEQQEMIEELRAEIDELKRGVVEQ